MTSNNIDVRISDKPLSIDRAFEQIVHDSCGGNCLFVGTVRDSNKGKSVTYLEFESYDEMAIKELHRIASRCIVEFNAEKVVIYHRSGRVSIKQVAVIIAICSKHRDMAFKACRFAIDELKKSVPIWKKEFLKDGSYWLGANP